jgi:hypothetical protein
MSTTRTSGIAPAAPPMVYKMPQIGGISTSGIPWVGGQPDSNWTETSNRGPKTPNCYRESIKNYNKRMEGSSDKLKADDLEYSINNFSDDVFRHME